MRILQDVIKFDSKKIKTEANMQPLTFKDTITQHTLIVAELPIAENISNYYLIDQDKIDKHGTMQIQTYVNNVKTKNRQQAIQRLINLYANHAHQLIPLEDFDDYMILKEYLETICEALLNNEHQKVNRLLKTATEQFATKNKQAQLQKEFKSFCEFAADELDDNMSWYFFNENLPAYVKEWQKEKLIEL